MERGGNDKEKSLFDKNMWVRCVLLSWFRDEVGVVWIFGEGNLCLWRIAQIGKKLSSPPLTNLLLKL